MPVLDFESEDGKIISVLVPLAAPDDDRHFQIQDGKTYKRIYAAPMAAKDMKVRDATLEDFTRVTGDKNFKVADMWKISKEMSQHREEKQGTDPVKEKLYRDHLKSTGKKHPEVIKREGLADRDKLYREMGVKFVD